MSTILRLAWRNPNQVEAADAFAPSKVHKIHPKGFIQASNCLTERF